MRHALASVILSATLLSLCSCPGSSANVASTTGSTSKSPETSRIDRRPAPKELWRIYGYGEGDATLPHVRGKGWYCYDVAYGDRHKTYCHRTKDQCSANRAEVLTEDGVHAEECRFRAGKAACLIVTLVRDGNEGHLCAPTPAGCEQFRMESLAARDTYLFVSQCEYIE